MNLANIRLTVKENILHYLVDDWNNHKKGKAHKENQALFDRKEGYACWTNIDLEMVMEKVVKGIYSTDFTIIEKELRKETINEFIEKLKPLLKERDLNSLEIIKKEMLK